MSLQRDPDGRRSVRVEVEVPGTPEQVWQAIATGPGISAWFVPATVEERAGGKLSCDFGGGMVSSASITAYEPPLRFAATDPGWAPGMPSVATEWTVEAKAGGTCIVRVVHSMFASTDDWDSQLEGTETGWGSFFRVLRRYLQHFAGQSSALVQATAMSQVPVADAWATLAAALAAGDLRVGVPLAVALAPGVEVRGQIERHDDLGHGRNVQVALVAPAPGTLLGGPMRAAARWCRSPPISTGHAPRPRRRRYNRSCSRGSADAFRRHRRTEPGDRWQRDLPRATACCRPATAGSSTPPMKLWLRRGRPVTWAPRTLHDPRPPLRRRDRPAGHAAPRPAGLRLPGAGLAQPLHGAELPAP